MKKSINEQIAASLKIAKTLRLDRKGFFEGKIRVLWPCGTEAAWVYVPLAGFDEWATVETKNGKNLVALCVSRDEDDKLSVVLYPTYENEEGYNTVKQKSGIIC